MRVFLVFTLDAVEDWASKVVGKATLLGPPPTGTSFTVIDNDCPPELEREIGLIANVVGARVQRIERTPKWRIVSDILTGRSLSGSTEPTLICSAHDSRIAEPIELRGLIGPPGEISEDFVYTTNPVELMESVVAKTRDWPDGVSPFAPAAIHTRQGLVQAPALGSLATMFGVDAAGLQEAPVGPMPDPVHETLVTYYRERLGDDAAGFLVRLQAASQIADDFVDGEMKKEWSQDAMRRMLEILLLEIPNDDFYREHRPVLEEAVAQCISVWHLSNELAADPTPESRLWCFVQRETFQMVIWRVAVIVGGLALGRDVLREIQQILHGPAGVGKRFPVWLAETRARLDGR